MYTLGYCPCMHLLLYAFILLFYICAATLTAKRCSGFYQDMSHLLSKVNQTKCKKDTFFNALSDQTKLQSGADLGFSRGGADFQKIFENFVDLFFKVDRIDFSSSH